MSNFKKAGRCLYWQFPCISYSTTTTTHTYTTYLYQQTKPHFHGQIHNLTFSIRKKKVCLTSNIDIPKHPKTNQLFAPQLFLEKKKSQSHFSGTQTLKEAEKKTTQKINTIYMLVEIIKWNRIEPKINEKKNV